MQLFLSATAVVSACLNIMVFEAHAVDLQDLRSAMDAQFMTASTAVIRPSGRHTAREGLELKLNRLYQERGLQPVWVGPDGLSRRAYALRAVLSAADTQGLNPADYSLDEINRCWSNQDAESLSRLELLLTTALRRYLVDLTQGRRSPRELDPQYLAAARSNQVDAEQLLQQALGAEDLGAFLEQQAPPFEQYRQLRQKLAEYRGIAAAGGWPQIPKGPSLKPGMRDARVPALRERLRITADLPAQISGEEVVYDQDTFSAVKHFQERHGLAADGVVGPETLAALNVTAAERVRQIMIAMESWRWVARSPGEWMLTVNIPGFELTASRYGKTELSMPVIVGKETTKTPVFDAQVRSVEFNPYWNVPDSISAKELLPKLRENPALLTKDNIRLFDTAGGGSELDSTAIDWASVTPEQMRRYHLRQDPGAGNSLGTIKLRMPNPFDVYLHDTPSRGLFQKPRRAFSHGCIRVSRPQELAAYVLGGAEKGWTEERVKQIVAKRGMQAANLDVPLPIYVTYRTAVVNSDTNQVYFYPDVYRRNPLLEKVLL